MQNNEHGKRRQCIQPLSATKKSIAFKCWLSLPLQKQHIDFCANSDFRVYLQTNTFSPIRFSSHSRQLTMVFCCRFQFAHSLNSYLYRSQFFNCGQKKTCIPAHGKSKEDHLSSVFDVAAFSAVELRFTSSIYLWDNLYVAIQMPYILNTLKVYRKWNFDCKCFSNSLNQKFQSAATQNEIKFNSKWVNNIC